MVTFVPSFIQKQSDPAAFESCEDEMPDPQDLPMIKEDKNFLFIFLVDRSGSMSGSKMTTTNEALILFLKSLPVGSSFEIISFGNRFTTLSKNASGFVYDDGTLNFAI